MSNNKAGQSEDHSETYHHADPVLDAAMEWFLRQEAQPDDADLINALEHWLDVDPSHRQAFDTIASMLGSPELARATDVLAVKFQPYVRGAEVVALPVRAKRRSTGWWQAGTAIAATLLLALGVYQYPALMLQWQADYITVAGELRTLTLPDGSQMSLNTASAVAVDFTKGKREVRLLQGEAYFDVKKDAVHPFVVSAQFSQTEVKGTAFAVQTGDDQDIITLQRGLVEVTHSLDPDSSVQLQSGQQIVAGSHILSSVRKEGAEASLAWLNGRISFTAEPLGQVVQRIGRYYPHSIFITRKNLKSAVVSGDYRLENPEGILRSLAVVTDSEIYRLPGGIIILN